MKDQATVNTLRRLLAVIVNNTKRNISSASEGTHVKSVLKKMLGRNPTADEVAIAQKY